MLNFLAGYFIWSGVIIIGLACIGFLRMPGPLMRCHVASMAPTLGKASILIGVSLGFASWQVAVIGVLVLLFLFLTAPVSSHLICRTAFRTKADLKTTLVRNDYENIR